MSKLLKFSEGGHGPKGVVTPGSLSANAVKRTVYRVVSLGTSTVSTATYVIAAMPTAGKVIAIQEYGQAAVTGTTLTGEVFARTTAGAAGNTLQSAANDVKFASAAAGKAGVSASLTATTANLTLAAGQLLEYTSTASSVTAGPGDLLVVVTYVPTEDAKVSGGYTSGADL
jgi:hypothetical protein